MFTEYNPKGFIQLLSFTKKSELTKYAKSLTIHKSDLANFILAAKLGGSDYLHSAHHRDFVPEHLVPKKGDINKIVANEAGVLEGQSQKIVNKLGQIFVQRRLLSGHMFYVPDHSFWHFFYFDQRDTSRRDNHWKNGSHIHFINHLWPDRTAKSVWEEFTTGKPIMKNSIHINYQDMEGDDSDDSI